MKASAMSSSRPLTKLERLLPARPTLTWLLVLAGTDLLVWADLSTGPAGLLAPLYVVPIALGGWLEGRRLARLAAAIATAVRALASLAGESHRSPALQAFTFVCQAALFWGAAVVVPRVRAALEATGAPDRLDPSSGALSRDAFLELAEREVARAARTGEPFALLCLRLEHRRPRPFLHRAADEAALHTLAAAARAALRASDLVGRLERRELAILLPATTPGLAHLVKDRVRRRLAAVDAEQGLQLEARVGTACFQGPTASFAPELLEVARGALEEESPRASEQAAQLDGRVSTARR
jgi:diguanylate cyclase (GGDEF)-like protein